MTDWKVGDECRYKDADKTGIIRHIEGSNVCYSIDGDLHICTLPSISRPKSTEEQKRDEVIGKALDAIRDGYDDRKDSLEILYDAGMLVEPDDKVVPISEDDYVSKMREFATHSSGYRWLVEHNHIKPA